MPLLEIEKRAADFIKRLPPKPFKQVMGKVRGLLKMPFPHHS